MIWNRAEDVDANERQDRGLLHASLTRKIIGCALEVINELGSGFLESVYEKALTVALSDAGVPFEIQKPIGVRFRGRPVGDFIADILVDDKVIVELKAVTSIAREHEAQIINYLNATGIEVGLIINFGKSKLEFKRFTRNKKHGCTGKDKGIEPKRRNKREVRQSSTRDVEADEPHSGSEKSATRGR